MRISDWSSDVCSSDLHAVGRAFGVEVVLGTPVTECSADGVVYGGKPLSAKTIVWAAGVQASPAARWLGAASDRAGRVVVGPDLTVAGRPEVFAIGDTASCTMADGKDRKSTRLNSSH